MTGDEYVMDYEALVGNLRNFYADEYSFLQPVYATLVRHTSRLLDLGCGIGAQAAAGARSGFSVVAVDRSMRALERAVALTNQGTAQSIWFVCADVLDIPLSIGSSFDLVQCLGNVVLLQRNVGDAERCVRNAVALLGPSGKLLLGLKFYLATPRWTRYSALGNAWHRVLERPGYVRLEVAHRGLRKEFKVFSTIELLALNESWLTALLGRENVLIERRFVTKSDYHYYLCGRARHEILSQ